MTTTENITRHTEVAASITPICTTLNRIRAHGPCSDGWTKLLAGLGKTAADDEPLPYARIVEISGIDDALWACLAEPQYAKEWRLFAVWCARQVEHLMQDERSREALNVAERYANGQAPDEELLAAWAAAEDAAEAAEAAAEAAKAAAKAAEAAAEAAAAEAAEAAAWAAARAAAGDARAAAGDAWAAAGDAWAAAGDAAEAAAGDAARDAQTKKFLEIVGERSMSRFPTTRAMRLTLGYAVAGGLIIALVYCTRCLSPPPVRVITTAQPWTGEELVIGGGGALVCTPDGACAVQGTGGGRPADEVKP